jgi:hypothetical protein
LTVSGGIAPGHQPFAYDAWKRRNNEGDAHGDALCRRIASALDPSSWPDVI